MTPVQPTLVPLPLSDLFSLSRPQVDSTLKDSLRVFGLRFPLVVTLVKIGGDLKRYEVVDGRARLACLRALASECVCPGVLILCELKEYATDAEKQADVLVMNLRRAERPENKAPKVSRSVAKEIGLLTGISQDHSSSPFTHKDASRELARLNELTRHLAETAGATRNGIAATKAASAIALFARGSIGLDEAMQLLCGTSMDLPRCFPARPQPKKVRKGSGDDTDGDLTNPDKGEVDEENGVQGTLL